MDVNNPGNPKPQVTPISDLNSTVKVTVRPAVEPDLINFKVSNPVTYLRIWWKKVMGKEGIDFRFRIHPITAILVASIIALGGFGVGRISLFSYIPVLAKIIQSPAPVTPQPINSWAEGALTGKLQLTPNTNKYYLITTSSIAVSLQFKEQIDLNKYVGKRILASGSYNQKTHVLIISDILDLEVLPASPVPIIVPPPSFTSPQPSSAGGPSPSPNVLN